jgi:hypothetical protein
VQGAADFHHQIADALLPQTNAVLHNATALDTAVDMLNRLQEKEEKSNSWTNVQFD